MKLPVFKAFFATLGYVLVHGLTLLRILWLPSLIMIAISLYFGSSMMDVQSRLLEAQGGDAASVPFAAMGDLWRVMGFQYLAMAVLYPMMMAGVLRHVIRGEAPRAPFYLSYGPSEIRILLTVVLIAIMTMIIYAVGVVAVAAIGGAVSALSSSAGAILAGIGAVVFVVTLIWFSLRLSMSFPACIGARKIGIARSWAVTRGNAWRLLFFWILIWIVMIGLIIAFMLVAMGDQLAMLKDVFLSAAKGDEAGIAAANANVFETQRSAYDFSTPAAWINGAGAWAYTMVSAGFTTAADGVAWRYLAGEERGA